MAAIISITASSSSSAANNGPTYRGPFAIMTVLFFMGGFMMVFNDILIPRLKEAFTLDYFHAMLVVPLACFLAFWALRSWNSDQKQFDFAASWAIMKNYLPLLGLCWVLFQFGQALAGRTLRIFGATIVILLAIYMVHGGKLAMWCIVGIGLFTSIGWPNIFALPLDGMGVLKSQVSSLLVMAILGGALLPPLQGFIADHQGLQVSFIVPLLAYAYVAFYGWKGHKIGRGKVTAAA